MTPYYKVRHEPSGLYLKKDRAFTGPEAGDPFKPTGRRFYDQNRARSAMRRLLRNHPGYAGTLRVVGFTAAPAPGMRDAP